MRTLKNIFGFKKGPDFINDRRVSKRYDIILKLNYSYPALRYSGESFTKNISQNGMRFPVKSKLTKGELLRIEIEDPNSQKLLSLKGRVAWFEEFSEEGHSDETTRYETGVSLLKKNFF